MQLKNILIHVKIYEIMVMASETVLPLQRSLWGGVSANESAHSVTVAKQQIRLAPFGF